MYTYDRNVKLSIASKSSKGSMSTLSNFNRHWPNNLGSQRLKYYLKLPSIVKSLSPFPSVSELTISLQKRFSLSVMITISFQQNPDTWNIKCVSRVHQDLAIL